MGTYIHFKEMERKRELSEKLGNSFAAEKFNSLMQKQFGAHLVQF